MNLKGCYLSIDNQHINYIKKTCVHALTCIPRNLTVCWHGRNDFCSDTGRCRGIIDRSLIENWRSSGVSPVPLPLVLSLIDNSWQYDQ